MNSAIDEDFLDNQIIFDQFFIAVNMFKERIETENIINLVSTSYYTKVFDNSGEECIICTDKFDGFIAKLVCNHIFHEKCILEWFSNKISCPICRNYSKYINFVV